ncbi:MAG: CBS domain-containing protein [Rhodospirillales bacterium]|jgi:CBS domain-containing protein
MLQSIEMKDFMSKDPVILHTDTALYDAVHLMLENKITGATVLDEEGHVVGVVSEMDLLRALEQIAYYNEGDGEVGDYMTKEITVIDEKMNIFDIANKLLELKIRRLPVVENGIFVGQISCRSILQAMKDSMCPHDDSEDDIHE